MRLAPALVERLAEELVAVPFVEPPARPLHVLYGGAHLFKAEAPVKLGRMAHAALLEHGADRAWFGRTFLAEERGEELWARVETRLRTEPIGAMCIDFEDGYGPRPDGEEDEDAARAGAELAKLDGRAAPRIGIRIKALSGGTVRRALRTLDLFLDAAGAVPEGFSVTVPKVTAPGQIAALDEALRAIEGTGAVARIPIEVMIETPRALTILPSLLAASDRVTCLHLGAYDLTAELGVTATDQRLDHPFNDAARLLLQAAVAGTRVSVSDGATTELPIAAKDAPASARADTVRGAWALHRRNVRRAIEAGIWQGWDLHPAQLVARYGAVFAFFLEHRAAMAARLGRFLEKATQATRIGGTFDDAATGLGLVAFFRRGLACGALDDADLAPTGLRREELDGRSFAAMVSART